MLIRSSRPAALVHIRHTWLPMKKLHAEKPTLLRLNPNEGQLSFLIQPHIRYESPQSITPQAHSNTCI